MRYALALLASVSCNPPAIATHPAALATRGDCHDPAELGAAPGDGQSDRAAIQAAIDAATARPDGGTVCVDPGRWTLDRAPLGSYNRFAALTLRGRHVTLRGAGPETVLELAGDQGASTTIVVDVLPGAEHVRIADLTIDTAGATNTIEQTHAIATSGTCASEACRPIIDLAIERVTFRHPAAAPGQRKGDCIRLLGNTPETEVRRVRIVGNDFESCARSAVMFQRGLHDVVIADNTIVCESCDQAIDGEATGGGWDHGLVITGNTITSGTGAQGEYAIALTSTVGAVVAGNKLDRGIALYRTRDTTVTGNTIAHVARSNDATIRVQNECDGDVLGGNTIRRTGAAGPVVKLEPHSGVACAGFAVSGNAITQGTAAPAIMAVSTSRASISGNVVTHTVAAPTFPSLLVYSAVAESPITALSIAGNTLYGATTYAITLEGRPGQFAGGVALTGNVAVGATFGLRCKNPTYFTSPLVLGGNTLGPGSYSGVTSSTGD